MCQLLWVTPGSPSTREKAGSAHWQPADTCTPTQNRPSTALECELHTETFLTIPHFAPSLFCSLGLTARSHSVLFLLIKHFRVMPGLCSPSQQSTREVRELSWAPGGGKKEIKRLPLPFADASLKMLWLRALCCHYSNLPCAIPGIHARVCGALHCSSLPLTPSPHFPPFLPKAFSGNPTCATALVLFVRRTYCLLLYMFFAPRPVLDSIVGKALSQHSVNSLSPLRVRNFF